MHRLLLLSIILLGCKSRSDAPVDCMRKGLERFNNRLTHAQLTHLCSATVDAEAPLDCFDKAKDAKELDVSDSGALQLCSPYNLDASNAAAAADRAANKSCPSVNVSDIERRLTNIEAKLDDNKRR